MAFKKKHLRLVNLCYYYGTRQSDLKPLQVVQSSTTTETNKIISEFDRIMDNPTIYESIATIANPYGLGDTRYQFYKALDKKSVKIIVCVLGLGYMGCQRRNIVSGFDVIGIDIDPIVVSTVNSG